MPLASSKFVPRKMPPRNKMKAISTLMQVGFKDVINKRRHCIEHSSRVTTSVARAEEVLESTQADHNREARSSLMQVGSKDVINKRRHCTEHSSRVTTSIARAEEVLESTQADHNREARSSLTQATSKLAIVLGLYARLDGYFPPYKEWKEQSPHSFNDVMKDIMRDYDFVDYEGLPANVNIVTHFCKESLQRKLRDWRCWLKAHYYIEGIPEEVLMKSLDKRVTQENWELLLKFWERGNKVSEAERNKRNCGKDRPTHTLGAKSIARHNQDEREKLGGNYTTIGAYLKAHQTKNGGYPDEYTRAMCLQNAKAEIESSKAVIEALRARDGETQARMERMEALLNAHLHSGIVLQALKRLKGTSDVYYVKQETFEREADFFLNIET
ncbi:hypothetical protein Taro_050868, partial [Colocasia esculenta]|nr:hypothetical protein [Colocasia esculenta]